MPTTDPSSVPLRRRLAAACLASVLVIGAGALGGSAAWAQQNPGDVPPELVIDESGWLGNAFLDVDGSFSHCAIGRDYSEEMEVLFLMGGDAQLNMIVSNTGFELTEGQEVNLRFRLDTVVNVEIPAPAVARQSVLIRIGNNPDVFQALRRGNQVELSGQGISTVRIPLTGTFNALPRLRACYDRARQLAADGTDLTQFVDMASLPEGVPQPGGTPQPDAPVEGATLLPEPAPRSLMPAQSLVGMMAAAGLPIGAFVNPERIPLDEMDAAYMWVSEAGLTGVLHQRPRGRSIRIDEFADYYMGIFGSVCDGSFALDMREAITWEDEFAVKTAVAECYEDRADGTRAGDVVSVFFALDQINYSAFIHLGRYAQRDAVVLAAEQLQEFVLDDVRAGEEAPATDPTEDEPAEGEEEAAPAAP